MSIRVKNIHKTFGDNYVLKGISMDFEDGEVNMIIGASGSGKSVFIKCILGLIKPDKGEVYIGDKDVIKSTRKQLRNLRKEIGVLFQSAALFDSMTVYENVSFPIRMFTNRKTEDIKKRVAECLEHVELSGREDLLPAELSGGMRKRVGLARAIALSPKYLVCDEPNSGLDPKTAETIDELITDLTHRLNMTTIVITHDMRSVLNYADHVLFIYKGRKEWEGTREEINQTENEPLLDFIRTSGLRLERFTES